MTEHAAVFDGLDDYVEIADHPDYSIATTGELTVVALIRPDSLEMPAQERTGYVHWLGKGVPGGDEWTFRMYQLGNSEGRGNRISCYAFNLDARVGGTRFGIGSHFQDELAAGAAAAGRGGMGRDPGVDLPGRGVARQRPARPVIHRRADHHPRAR